MIFNIYLSILDLPKYFFWVPFFTKKKIYFGQKSYNLYLKKSKSKNKFGYESKVITMWRETIHILSSFILLFIINFFFNFLLFVYIALLISYMSFQEFILQPKEFDQPLWKGILDFLSWILPIFLFI